MFTEMRMTQNIPDGYIGINLPELRARSFKQLA
jgi:hypothetical protein